MAKKNKLLDKFCKIFIFVILIAILYSLVRLLLSKIIINRENMENQKHLKDYVLNSHSATVPPPPPAPAPPPQAPPAPASPASSNVSCAADFNSNNACCGQPGTAVALEHQCPESSPICRGYIINKNWGTCGPATANSN